ncbi:hypothetical protein GCM10027446_00620 [Angustibacter peucedani]
MAKHTVQVVAEVTARPDEIYHHWNERSDYPRFVPDVAAVQPLDEVWSRWTPDDGTAPFDVELTDAVPQRCVAWRCHRPSRDRATVRLWPSGPGATRLELEVGWHAADDADRDRWRAWAHSLLEGFTAVLLDEHASFVDDLTAGDQLPHTD